MSFIRILAFDSFLKNGRTQKKLLYLLKKPDEGNYFKIFYMHRQVEFYIFVLYTCSSFFIYNFIRCYSKVGKQQAKEQVVSLDDGCIHRGTIMHELMHVVGFWHEQSRTDRDDFVIILVNNISPCASLFNI